jgi:7-cyano-7-deazaguanine synthase
MFFDYGQKSLRGEKKAMLYCAKNLKVRYRIVDLKSLRNLIHSGITHDLPTKNIERRNLRNTKEESLKFYIPFRNTIFASYALSYAETLKNSKNEIAIFFGFKSEGSEHYPDTTKQYVAGLNTLVAGMKIKGIEIKAPLINFDKEDIVSIGFKLEVPLDKTFSCYVSQGLHCGECLACALRKEGFYWANIEDKTKYIKK